ncbi:MAG TPA: hypothetical protein VIM65_12690 [Cyclobacteriaceae bacterium]
MKPDPTPMVEILRRRQQQIQKIIRQMKDDKLNSSTVYRNLETELESLKSKLTEPALQNGK